MTTEVKSPMPTIEWFRRAVPAPAHKNFHVQLGVHVEEFGEHLESLSVDAASAGVLAAAITAVKTLAAELKTGGVKIESVDWHEFFDAIIDQRVTGTGLAYMIGGDLDGAVAEVDGSNESKFVDGKAIFDENGKIKKGPGYWKANLAPYMPTVVTILDK